MTNLNENTEDEKPNETASPVECLVMRFNACKYLDFSDNYAAKKQLTANGKVFWLRDVSHDPALPAMVQFCSKSGRLNHPGACLCDDDKHCGDYVDFEHEVNVPAA